MATGYDAQYYRDITRIADALEQIARLLERLPGQRSIPTKDLPKYLQELQDKE
jgi:hypothetical protein